MLKPLSLAKKLLTIGFSLILLNLPVTAFADSPGTDKCTPPPATQAGVHWPTGADAGTFTYQCDGAYAGKWINTYYIYDPATATRTPRYDPNYTYDCAANQWYMTEYDYSPAQGAYQKNTVKTSAPSGIATGCPVAASSDPAAGGSGGTSGGGSGSPQSLATSPAGSPAGSTGINQTGSNNLNVNDTTGATMSNGITSIATSGDADVTANTNAGSATSGNAQAIANVINMLQSSSNVLGNPNMITFTANINGDVNGDLLLDPATLGAVQPANSSTSLDNNVTVNNSTDATMSNDINLDATSGDADVAYNTNAGSATSGNADAVANIVNILNSAVTAGKSFVGVININGDLNGDILLPPNFVDTLLASNVPRYTVNTSDLNSNVNVTNNNNQSINNAVSVGADSGDAAVTANTKAGSATSGLANTNLTVFNLTGSNVVASNDLLVFVNVLGTWYGMIMNAPVGSTAASLGGGVITNTSVNNNATLNNTNNQSINNNVHVNAASGDANVKANTNAGDAKSGNANASVNLINMINDSLSLNGWFGLLFINVYGTWNGSFGIDTAAGNPPAASTPSPASSAGGGTGPMFRFVPVGTVPGSSQASYYSGGGSASGGSSDGTVLAAKTVKSTSAGHKLPTVDTVTPAQKATNHYLLPALGTILAFAILFVGERRSRSALPH